MFERFLYRIVYILFGVMLWMALTSKAEADNVLIYHGNYSDTYTNVKAQMEADGHTVTGSTSTTVASNLINSYDVVIDLLYNNNCGSTCRGNYDDFVEAGGVLIITGENESYFSSRNSNIENLISNKFGGTLTIGNASGTVDTFNSTYTDNTTSYTLAGGGSLSGDGEWVAKVGTTVVWMTWQGADLPSGYTGAVYVTADINQFQTQYGGSAAKALYSDLVSYSLASSSTPTYSSEPTSAQLQSRTDARGITSNGNAIYVTQSGDRVDIDITQYDNDNLVAGTSTTSSTMANATISGDDNTVNITQGNNAGSFSDDNVTLLDINGTNNSITVRQGDNVDDAGGHRSSTNVVGNYNTLGILQENDGGIGSNGHYMEIDVAGNSNIMYMDQKDDGDKMLFLDVNGSSNDVDIIQQGTGEHFLDVTAGSNQTIDILQDGSGSHAATIDMSGYSSTLDLDQTGSTDKTYSLTQTCTNLNGCGTTTVTQN